MKTRSFRLLFILITICSVAFGQRLKKADRLIVSNLQSHITYLADDKLEGRRAGTKGEKLAGEYITGVFEKLGLQPKGANSWFQNFEIYDGKQILPASHFSINGSQLKLYSDYFPFSFSASKQLKASVVMDLAEEGVPWFIDLKDLFEEVKNNPHTSLPETINAKAAYVSGKGATALIIYNSSTQEELSFDSSRRSEAVEIPVLYIARQATNKYLHDKSANLDIALRIEIVDKIRTGRNIAAYLNNGAGNTIIIGAHYDHIGFGEDGNSLAGKSTGIIHNGADDNASGVAGLMELARLLKHSRQKTSNFLFIAFSGEESGLYGSKYFTEHPTIDLQKVSYMINMDMIGRLNDSSKALTIGGYGTSPSWAPAFAAIPESKYFSLKYDSSGAGPSDHTSFYNKEIPVLFFFTGLHSDYHKPGDDANKINFTGEMHVVKYIGSVIDNTSKLGKLTFLKTRDHQFSTQAKFSVTLGIMPDYVFSGNGVRVDGISDGRPAQKAGLKAGDIILQLSDYSTASLELYMKALSNFKKGDKTSVKYLRGSEIRNADVEF